MTFKGRWRALHYRECWSKISAHLLDYMLLLNILSGDNLNYVVLRSDKVFFFFASPADKNNETNQRLPS